MRCDVGVVWMEMSRVTLVYKVPPSTTRGRGRRHRPFVIDDVFVDPVGWLVPWLARSLPRVVILPRVGRTPLRQWSTRLLPTDRQKRRISSIREAKRHGRSHSSESHQWHARRNQCHVWTGWRGGTKVLCSLRGTRGRNRPRDTVSLLRRMLNKLF